MASLQVLHAEVNFDHRIFNALNSLAHRSALMDSVYIFLAVGLAFVMAAVIVIYWFINSDTLRARKAIIVSLVAFVLSRFVFVEIVRALWARSRPFVSYDTIHPLIELLRKGNQPSFPSGHASAMFAIALSIYFYNRRLGWLMFGFAVLTGFARIVVGVHYPSDIAAGAITGLAFAWLTERRIAPRLDSLVKRVSDASDRFFRRS